MAYRGFYAGCECGEDIRSAGPVDEKTARWQHAEHKKAVVRGWSLSEGSRTNG